MKCLLLTTLTLLLTHTSSSQALLWKISGHGLTHPCYLFATMHPICREEARLSARVLAALDSCTTVYLEFRQDSSGFKQEIRSLAKMHDEKFEDLFTHEEYRDIKKTFQERLHIPLGFIQHYKPFTYWSLVTSHLPTCRHVINTEDLLTEQAQDRHLQLRGLETIAETYQTMDAMPRVTLAQVLLEYARNWDTLQVRYQEAKHAYFQQDLQMIEAIGAKPPYTAVDQALDEAILYSRTQRWMPRIEAALPQGATFIACGASHLVGPRGLLALLQQDGYTLTPQP